MEHSDKEDFEVLWAEIRAAVWFGFDHDSTRIYDVVDFKSYATLRGWNRDELERIKVGSLTQPSVEVLSMLL